MFPRTFADPADYDRIDNDDRIAVGGLATLTEDEPATVEVAKPSGETIVLHEPHVHRRADRVPHGRLGTQHHHGRTAS